MHEFKYSLHDAFLFIIIHEPCGERSGDPVERSPVSLFLSVAAARQHVWAVRSGQLSARSWPARRRSFPFRSGLGARGEAVNVIILRECVRRSHAQETRRDAHVTKL